MSVIALVTVMVPPLLVGVKLAFSVTLSFLAFLRSFRPVLLLSFEHTGAEHLDISIDVRLLLAFDAGSAGEFRCGGVTAAEGHDVARGRDVVEVPWLYRIEVRVVYAAVCR